MLNSDYSSIFDRNYKRFNHYLDAALAIFKSVPIIQSTVRWPSYYTAVDDKLFLPPGLYFEKDTIPIIFDSGCTTSVTPYLTDFVNPPTPVDKYMEILSSSSKVKVQGLVDCTLKDDYVIRYHLKVNTYYISTRSVR